MKHRRQVPKPGRRRALELLAASPHGCTEVARVRLTEAGDSRNSRIVELHEHNARGRVASADVLMEKLP
jgi:hypothetical protein